MEYAADARNQFTNWRLEVSGLVQQPSRFSLAELKSMPARTQITRHDCVEGWSAIGKWKGVPLGSILDRVQPHSEQLNILSFIAWTPTIAASIIMKAST